MIVAASLQGRLEDNAVTVASRLGAGAALLGAALPVAMALANRSAPLIVALAAATLLASLVARAGWSAASSAFWASLRSCLGFAALAFLALSIASYGWSVDRAQTLRALGEGVVPLVAGAVLLRFLPCVAPRWIGVAVAIGVIIAASICIGELRFDMPIRNALHLRAKAFEYNRPVLVLLVLFWPLAGLALSSHPRALSGSPRNIRDDKALDRSGGLRQAAMSSRLALWLALAATTAAIWCSQSGTAMFAQALSIPAALCAARFPRACLLATAIVVAIVFLCAFAFGDIAWRVLPGATYEALAWTHAADRVEIWRSFGAAMLVHPVLGAGFGTTVTLGDTAIAGEVATEFRRMLSVGHPHNGFLQIGVELGVVGCALALATVLTLLWNWRRLAAAALWPRIGLLTMVAATMLIGHGAWQAWWIAVVFAGAGLIGAIAGKSVGPDAGQEEALRA
ncbi:MAG: O-antigen ligase family protein [Hyphomicrobiales bacterium]